MVQLKDNGKQWPVSRNFHMFLPKSLNLRILFVSGCWLGRVGDYKAARTIEYGLGLPPTQEQPQPFPCRGHDMKPTQNNAVFDHEIYHTFASRLIFQYDGPSKGCLAWFRYRVSIYHPLRFSWHTDLKVLVFTLYTQNRTPENNLRFQFHQIKKNEPHLMFFFVL